MGWLQLRSDTALRPMGPEKIAEGEGQAETYHNVELMEIVSQMLPLLSHFHADIGEKVAPGQCAEKGEEYEPINIHSGDAGRQRDEGPDDRKHSAEKYRCLAIFLEPSIRHLDVFSRHQYIRPI